MKRYFLTEKTPSGELGEWHSIDLESHGSTGHAVVLCDEHVEAPARWAALPHVLDARTTVGETRLRALGITADHTMMDAALKLAAVHRMFRP